MQEERDRKGGFFASTEKRKGKSLAHALSEGKRGKSKDWIINQKKKKGGSILKERKRRRKSNPRRRRKEGLCSLKEKEKKTMTASPKTQSTKNRKERTKDGSLQRKKGGRNIEEYAPGKVIQNI